MLLNVVLHVTLWSLGAVVTSALPTGLVSECPSGPQHGSGWGTGTPPYTLQLRNFAGVVTTYNPLQTYNLDLVAPGSTKFKGFVIAGFAQSGIPTFNTDLLIGGMDVTQASTQVRCHLKYVTPTECAKPAITFSYVAPTAHDRVPRRRYSYREL